MLDIDKDISKLSPRLEAHRDFTAYGELLGESDVPATFRDRYGYDAVGVKRTALNLLLRDHVLRSGIDVREGWVLDRIDEQSDCVTAYFNGGRSASGSLLIGCDGIKAASRSLILKAKSVVEEEPGYTGLSQVGSRTARRDAGADDMRGRRPVYHRHLRRCQDKPPCKIGMVMPFISSRTPCHRRTPHGPSLVQQANTLRRRGACIVRMRWRRSSPDFRRY